MTTRNLPLPELKAEDLLTPRETAAFARVSARTIWDWCNNKRILPVIKVGRKVLIDRTDVINLLVQSKTRGDGE